MNDTHSRGLTRRHVPRFHEGTWKGIEDVVSDERPLLIEWRDETAGDGGRTELWSWPYDLEPLALGHVLLDIRPQGGTLARECSVRQKAENEYAVSLGAMREEAAPEPLRGVSGETLARAMRAFIKAEGQWDGTGCFHRAGVFDPASGTFPARAEDIGRHNCLDRLAGWSALHSVSLARTILFTSARITASLFAKARRAGFPILVSRSAVTTASIAQAEECGISLIGFARTDEERLTLFADPLHRILVDDNCR